MAAKHAKTSKGLRAPDNNGLTAPDDNGPTAPDNNGPTAFLLNISSFLCATGKRRVIPKKNNHGVHGAARSYLLQILLKSV
jgi:hypothetical protein